MINNGLIIQQNFLNQIKQKLPENISMVDEISEKLNLSNDSTYRRLRGEKDFTFDEMTILSKAYNISLDSLISNEPSEVTFNYRSISNVDFTLESYLISIIKNLKYINSFEGEKQLIYLSKDFPIFHYFDFPAIASFKMFFWLKFILNHPDYKGREFSFDSVPAEIMQTGKEILHEYIKVPATEIWNKETVNSTLNQIEYFFESGLFLKKEDALLILDELKSMMHHINTIAETGIKFNYNGKQINQQPNYRLYYNEVTIGDNTIHFKMGNQRVSFIIANVLNILTTRNEKFCGDIEFMMDNIMRKSIEISTSSERIRSKFFKTQQDKIELIQKKLLSSI